jgi:hypothetical protein
MSWVDRDIVLAPIAAYARGAAAAELARKLSTWPADRLAKLSGVSAKEAIVLIAKQEADLPWVDGIQYLGKDPDAPQLLLPTARAPAVHAGLFERAIVAKARTVGLIAVLPDPPAAIIPLKPALPLTRAKLELFLGAAR